MYTLLYKQHLDSFVTDNILLKIITEFLPKLQMNQAHRDYIRKNYIQLADCIMPSIETVCKNLWQAKIISKQMMEDIMEGKNTDRKRAMALLDLLPTRGPYAFDAFYDSLYHNELYEAAYILKPEMRKRNDNPSVSFHIPQSERHFQTSPRKLKPEDEMEDELPNTWPSVEALQLDDVRTITRSDKKFYDLFLHSSDKGRQSSYYNMNTQPKGRVLIINNEKFNSMPTRDGSNKDSESIKKVFGRLGFEYEMVKNLTKLEIEEKLNVESLTDFSNMSCYVIFVLTHGHEEVIFGTDGYTENGVQKNCVKITYMKDKISSNNTLYGKPKIFFIQACQGTQKDTGYYVNAADYKPDSTNQQQAFTPGSQEQDTTHLNDIDLNQLDQKDGNPIYEDKKILMEEVLPQEASDASGPKLASHADIFVALATTAGYLSWRNTKYGTWFVQAITYVFAKYAYKHDLNRLMTMVNSLVAKAETIKGKYKQVAEKRDTFTKTLYFFPGLPTNE